jgi:hypothetical protein
MGTRQAGVRVETDERRVVDQEGSYRRSYLTLEVREVRSPKYRAFAVIVLTSFILCAEACAWSSALGGIPANSTTSGKVAKILRGFAAQQILWGPKRPHRFSGDVRNAHYAVITLGRVVLESTSLPTFCLRKTPQLGPGGCLSYQRQWLYGSSAELSPAPSP